LLLGLFGLADRTSVLHLRQVIANGAPAEIRANPDVQRAHLGRTNMAHNVLLDVARIETFYGTSRILHDVSFTVPRGGARFTQPQSGAKCAAACEMQSQGDSKR
jgi:hypothetical protein